MHVDEMIPSKYIKASDLKGRGHVVVISHLEQAEFKDQKTGKEQKKWVVFFVGKQKGMTLNVVNLKKVAKLHGPESNQWPGKSIEIYPTETSFGGEEVDCIRIREAQSPAVAPAPQPAPPPPQPRQSHDERNPPLSQMADMDDSIPFAPEWR